MQPWASAACCVLHWPIVCASAAPALHRWFETLSGVTAIDFSASAPNILALGLYSGAVAVYDVRQKAGTPSMESDAATGKHSDPVWKVRVDGWVVQGVLVWGRGREGAGCGWVHRTGCGIWEVCICTRDRRFVAIHFVSVRVSAGMGLHGHPGERELGGRAHYEMARVVL